MWEFEKDTGGLETIWPKNNTTPIHKSNRISGVFRKDRIRCLQRSTRRLHVVHLIVDTSMRVSCEICPFSGHKRTFTVLEPRT